MLTELLVSRLVMPDPNNPPKVKPGTEIAALEVIRLLGIAGDSRNFGL